MTNRMASENHIIIIFIKHQKFESLKYNYFFFIIRTLHHSNLLHIMKITRYHKNLKSNNMKIEICSKIKKTYNVHINTK